MCAILSLLQVDQIFVSSGSRARIAKRKFEVKQGDLITGLNAYLAWSKRESTEAHAWARNNFLKHKALQRVRTLSERMLSLLKKLDIPIISAEGSL